MPKELTQEYLKECLDYDPNTGKFTWRHRPVQHFVTEAVANWWNSCYAGTKAGNVDETQNGYRQVRIGINKRLYLASRLAWFYMTGAWPDSEIDHLDHNPENNAFGNLRGVTKQENLMNKSRYANNTSGTTGVRWNKDCRKWQAIIYVGGRQIYGGLFASFDDALMKRKELETEYVFHKNHGIRNHDSEVTQQPAPALQPQTSSG